MPKKLRTKNSDYLRFRPYRAFTAPSVHATEVAERKALWRTVLILAVVALLIAGAVWLRLR
jgi:hypothetical protein